MYTRRKRHEGKAPIQEREPSVSPVPIPGKKDEKNTNEEGNQPERRWSSIRTKLVINPNEDSNRPERSGVSGQKNQLSGKKYSSKRDDAS